MMGHGMTYEKMLIVMDRKATMLLSEHENICVGSHTGGFTVL